MSEGYNSLFPKSPERGTLSKILDYLKDRVLPEIAETAIAKTAHGADELSNALFSGSAYLPWPGAGQNAAIEQESMYEPPVPSRQNEQDREIER